MKAPGIIGEILNLSKQSCENITTSKFYLKRKKKGKAQKVILKGTIIGSALSSVQTALQSVWYGSLGDCVYSITAHAQLG